MHTQNNPSALGKLLFKMIAEMLYGVDEVSRFENELGEIVIKTTCGCVHTMANVDSITAMLRGRYAGGSHIILSSSHITHSESSLRPMPRREIEASQAGRDSESLSESCDDTAPVRIYVHVSTVYR